jgi:hypothetical protein
MLEILRTAGNLPLLRLQVKVIPYFPPVTSSVTLAVALDVDITPARDARAARANAQRRIDVSPI